MPTKYSLTAEQQKRVNELRKMSPSAYEKICKGCGICCLHKIGTQNITLYTKLCCDHLDLKTKRCKIYSKRLSANKYECTKVTPDLVLDGDLVPRTCGYVEYIFGPALQPINLDWSMVRHCNNLDLDDNCIAINAIIPDSINWKQR